MLVHPLYKLIHLRKNTPDGIAAIYINSALRTFAISLVGVFLPVFLFLQAQAVWGEGIQIGFYGIILYFFIQKIATTLFLLPSAKVVSKTGFRWSIFLANILLIILLGLLSVAEGNFWIIPFAAIIHGLQTPLYWLPYRSLFAREGVLSNIGREVGFSAISTQLAGIAGPALGGIIITVWGFSGLFIVALVVVVVSGVPFFFMSRHEHKVVANLKSVIGWLKNSKHRNEELSFMGRNINSTIYSLFWPIFVFLILGNFEKQGLVASLSLVAGVVMVYVAGRIFDKKHSNNVYKFGVVLNSIAWIARGFVKTLNQLVVVETFAQGISPLYWVTFDSLLYERAREKDEQVMVFMVGRLLVISLAVFLVLAFALTVSGFEWRFWALWIMALLGALSTKYMWEKKDDEKS
jgi:MFS family permease